MKKFRLTLLAGVAAALTAALFAAEKKTASDTAAMTENKVIDPATLQWGDPPPGLPPGAQAVVLSGDSTKKGINTVRMKAPAGYKIMPHTHPTAEHITVLSGSFHMGTGDKFDDSAGHTIAVGGFMTMPANTKHFAWTTEESIIQVHAEGPFVIKYVNPSDDPRGAKK